MRRAAPRRGTAGCWPNDAMFQQGSAVRLIVCDKEVVGNVRKCDDSASVYQIEYTWADDGKTYLEWLNSEDLEAKDPPLELFVSLHEGRSVGAMLHEPSSK